MNRRVTVAIAASAAVGASTPSAATAVTATVIRRFMLMYLRVAG